MDVVGDIGVLGKELTKIRERRAVLQLLQGTRVVCLAEINSDFICLFLIAEVVLRGG